MQLNLEEVYDTFLNLDGADDTACRELLQETLQKFMQETGNDYAGIANIIYKLDNHICDLDEAFEIIKDYCQANDLKCDALDVDEPAGWGSEDEEDTDCEVYKRQHPAD
jgi:hypothetical protein